MRSKAWIKDERVRRGGIWTVYRALDVSVRKPGLDVDFFFLN